MSILFTVLLVLAIIVGACFALVSVCAAIIAVRIIITTLFEDKNHDDETNV